MDDVFERVRKLWILFNHCGIFPNDLDFFYWFNLSILNYSNTNFVPFLSPATIIGCKRRFRQHRGLCRRSAHGGDCGGDCRSSTHPGSRVPQPCHHPRPQCHPNLRSGEWLDRWFALERFGLVDQLSNLLEGSFCMHIIFITITRKY